MLEVRLLGPLEVVDGEQVLTPHRQKPRALLAALALRVGRPVSKDVLVELLWGEAAPRRAVDALENYVSQLRKTLGRDAIATRPAGYQLELQPEQVDVVRLERLVAEARTAAAAGREELLRSALQLFRGPPLADLAFEPFAQTEIGRLDELELTIREELIDAELELGRHVDVVPDLERLIAAHPYRERPRGQLMLALYRSGRQAESLQVFQEARRVLVDELGIDPSEQLQELEGAILRQDEALRAPPRVERSAADAALPPPRPHRPARKTVTVLVSMLVDEGLAEGIDAELLQGVLDRYRAAVLAAAERHGGTLAGAPFDGAAVVFGIPAAHEDDALRSVRAAVEMREAVAALNDELLAAHGVFLQTRTGIGTGEVLVTAADEGGVPTGRPLVVARRLAAAARPGQIVLAEETRQLVRESVSLEEIAAGEGAFRVLELLRGDAGRRLRLDAPMVGRARPLVALAAAFAAVVEDRACHLVTVLGAAGVGKSRLVREFLDGLGDSAAVQRGRCLPYGEGITFWPLLDALPEDSLGGIDLTAEPRLVFASVRSVLEDLARSRPLVLVLDDLQWAEPMLLDVVEDVAASVREAPLLLLCLARPELIDDRPGWGGGKLNASSMLLEPLSDADAERLLDNLLGESDLPDPIRGYIVDASGGNPLFVEELLTTLVERNVLQRHAGRWTTTESLIPIPPSIQALLAARIDRLPDDERLVLELASVEGKLFTREVVGSLAPDDVAPEVDVLLDRLVRKELVRPRVAGGHTFRHQLIRDAAYGSIPKQVRAELHERVAELLDEDPGGGPEQVEIAAYHREQARRYRAELGSSD